MDNEKINTNNANQLFRDGDGLFLKGLVVASEVFQRTHEGLSYKKLKVSVSDGKSAYQFITTDKKRKLPEIQLFRRCQIAVSSVKREKDSINVFGRFDHV